MKKLLLLLVAVASLAAAAQLSAATVTVQITRTGFVPGKVTIKAGDTVTFHNADTAVHQVVFTKLTGITCAPTTIVLQADQSASCTFAAAGTFDYRDPTQKGSFKGTVVVQAAPASVSLSAKPLVLVYGGRTTLSGAVSTAQPNEKVAVQAQACGESAAKTLSTATTTTAGAWSYVAQPLRTTTYTARWKNVASSSVVVKVRPRVRLGKVAPRRYTVRVTAAESMAGKVVSFQRYIASLGRWSTVKRVVLVAGPSAVAPNVNSSRTFTARVKARLKVRGVITQAQVGSCYQPGYSNVIFS
jgi:plastocyanin